jgi:hypothetical protein
VLKTMLRLAFVNFCTEPFRILIQRAVFPSHEVFVCMFMIFSEWVLNVYCVNL